MTFTVAQVSLISSPLLRQVFDDCEQKIDEGTYPMPAGLTSDEKFAIIRQDFDYYAKHHAAIEVHKDGYFVAALCGYNNGAVFHHVLFIAGMDQLGSRSYLYDPAFVQGIADFHRDRGDLETKASVMSERPMVGYNNTVWEQAGCHQLISESESFDLNGNAVTNWKSVL